MKDVDGMFDYRDPSYGNDSSCRLRVYQLADRVALVIATELEDNPGPSVTNSAESWASEAVKEYSLDPARTYFVEHYDERSYDPPRRLRYADRSETFDFVEFKWIDVDGRPRATSPKWRAATREEVEKLVGQSLDE